MNMCIALGRWFIIHYPGCPISDYYRSGTTWYSGSSGSSRFPAAQVGCRPHAVQPVTRLLPLLRDSKPHNPATGDDFVYVHTRR